MHYYPRPAPDALVRLMRGLVVELEGGRAMCSIAADGSEPANPQLPSV